MVTPGCLWFARSLARYRREVPTPCSPHLTRFEQRASAGWTTQRSRLIEHDVA